MSEKMPWFKFYASDWQSDENVLFMDFFERGVYLELLLRNWVEGSIPSSPSKCLILLTRFASTDSEAEREKIRKALQVILPLFHQSADLPGRLVHPKLEEQRRNMQEISQKRANAGRKGGKSEKKNKSENPSEKSASKCLANGEANALHKEQNINTKEKYKKERPEENPEIPAPPSLAEVKTAFDMQGGTEEMATAFFAKHDQLDWRNAHGRPNRNWRSGVKPYITNWQSNAARKPKNSTGPDGVWIDPRY